MDYKKKLFDILIKTVEQFYCDTVSRLAAGSGDEEVS